LGNDLERLLAAWYVPKPLKKIPLSIRRAELLRREEQIRQDPENP
jgi:hypothetical protein